jgi:HK97 gp10 family phage protein
MSRLSEKTSIAVEGLDELRETLSDIAPREVNNILRAAVHGLAGVIRDAMRQAVKKRTGRLGKTIVAVRRRGGPNFPVSEVRVGHRAPYGLMLEFGTSRTRAQPYILPTVERARPALPETYREQFGKKLEANLARRAKKART